jgi:hypothetical protein
MLFNFIDLLTHFKFKARIFCISLQEVDGEEEEEEEEEEKKLLLLLVNADDEEDVVG